VERIMMNVTTIVDLNQLFCKENNLVRMAVFLLEVKGRSAGTKMAGDAYVGLYMQYIYPIKN
jgi:hypothetical protein